MNPEELLTQKDVVSRYKIGLKAQEKYRKECGLPFIRMGGRKIYYNKEVFDLWIKQFSVNEVAEETK